MGRSRSRSDDRKRRRSDKERERDRDKDREKDRDKDKIRNREKEREKDRDIDKDKKYRERSRDSRSKNRDRSKKRKHKSSRKRSYSTESYYSSNYSERKRKDDNYNKNDTLLPKNKPEINTLKTLSNNNLYYEMQQLTYPQALEEGPTEKVVKDQNLLNSDDKLFESIVDNAFSLRSLFDSESISKKLSGNLIYKAAEKLLYNPCLSIFEKDKEDKDINSKLTKLELVRLVVDNIIDDYDVESEFFK